MSDPKVTVGMDPGGPGWVWLVDGRFMRPIMGASNTDPGDAGDAGAAGAAADDGDDGDTGDQGAPPAQAKGKGKAKAKAAADDGVPDPVGEWFDQLPPEGKQYFRELKRTASGSSAKARQAQQQLDAIQQSTMSTEQKLQVSLDRANERAERSERKLREQSVRASFARSGQQFGAIYPNDLWRQVDPDDIRWDAETGEVLNADELVDAMRRNYPKLFEERRPTASVDAGRRTPPGQRSPDPNTLMNNLIRRGR